jgi:aerobic C4-dicarboxylate transport protein
MVIGIALGHFYPSLGAKMQPLGDAFIKAIRVLIAPIIFCTVVLVHLENIRLPSPTGNQIKISFTNLPWLAPFLGQSFRIGS